MILRDRFGKFMADTKFNRLCVKCREHKDEIKIMVLAVIFLILSISSFITLAMYEAVNGLLK